MRVLVFHGYPLRGTGSNVFNAKLAAALVGLGHEVHLLCQERHAEELDFVSTVADWDSRRLSLSRVRDGGCTVYRPDIGPLLPVFVADDYEGVTARTFPELTDFQLSTYIAANVAAVGEVVNRVKPDLAIANHLIMGPMILALGLAGTGIPYVVQIHGSALEYTVKPNPRFLPYARQGLHDARAVLVGSRHTANSLWAAIGDPELARRTVLNPPGVDVDRLRPCAAARARARGQRLADRLRAGAAPAGAVGASFTLDRDANAAGAAVAALVAERERHPLIGFVGKLILSKGIDLLLAAWPLVLAEVPDARLAVVGFGAFEEAARRLVSDLAAGNWDSVRALADAGHGAEGGPPGPARLLNAFLDRLESSGAREGYLGAASAMAGSVTFVGRLEHDELADFLPLCQAIVVPSTFPEAFGMVVAEAAARGVFPISARHSGLAEVSAVLAQSLAPEAAEPLTFPVDELVVESIAGSVVRWLELDPGQREKTRRRLADTAAARYSWRETASRAAAAAQYGAGAVAGTRLGPGSKSADVPAALAAQAVTGRTELHEPAT